MAQQLPDEVLTKLREQIRAEDERRQKFGQVRPIITAELNETRIVAIGNQIAWGKEWRTFPDFLRDYIRHLLGRSWWEAELKKPLHSRHEILKWWDAMVRFQCECGRPEPDGTLSAVPNGATRAFLLLAYDLYVLRDHLKLQRRTIERLKHPDQFQGARYELFAAAACIRAGFQINHEDETDGSRKHPEFAAIHRTGLTVWVEAKSRHRPGVLSRKGQREPDSELKAGITQLLDSAIVKDPSGPFVIFIDLNLPHSERPVPERPWFQEIVTLANAPATSVAFSMILFTNFPHHYSQGNSPAPSGTVLAEIPLSPKFPVDQAVLRELYEAALKAENIPNDFDRLDR